MNLEKILSVSGKKGLYKFVSQSKNNVVVESLSDGSRMPVFASTKASTLDNIAIFTDGDELPLKEVFKRIYKKENGGKTVDVSAARSTEIEACMAEIIPEYDPNRVHVSDMKKIFSWYNQLLECNLLSFEEEENEEKAEEEEEKTE
jgi:hypothetical protein